MVSMRSSGIHFDHVINTGFLDEMPEYGICGGRAADIAHADE